jgi:hypothetical protein
MKKKLILGLVASTLALTLAVGGTLMLFTAQSETATNVVTLGNAAIELREVNYNADDYDPENKEWTKVDPNGEFPGNTFTDSYPGQKLTKEPLVVNTGTVPVFVKVDGKIVFTGKDGTELGWSAVTDIINETLAYELSAEDLSALNVEDDEEATQANKNYAFLVLVLGDDINDDAWRGVPITAADVANAQGSEEHTEFYGTWYYAKQEEGASAKTLTSLTANSSTTTIFDAITVPLGLGDKAQEVTVNLELTAYAVQSYADFEDNGVESWEELFNGFFAAEETTED